MWSPQQEDALARAGRWLAEGDNQVFRIFGYAGTGKTTLAKYLAEGVHGNVYFAAFTGKAAHVLSQKGCPASTIHSLIYHSRDKGKARLLELEQELEETVNGLRGSGATQIEIDEDKNVLKLKQRVREETKNLSQPHFVLDQESVIRDASLIVIDECSMVDNRMGEDLLSFGVPVLVLGDPAQLPPVMGTGFFTHNVKPDVMLTEIHRQAQESGIIRLATEIREGRQPKLGNYGEDCKVVNVGDIDMNTVLAHDQIIVGRNRTRHAYNRRMRQIKGLLQEGGDPYPVEGDRVVCLRNNHDLGLLNGAIFHVHRVGGVIDEKIYMEVIPEGGRYTVEVSAHAHYFEGRGEDLPYWERKSAEEFDFGYAMTCHKSQGSQWDGVITFDESSCFRENWSRWSYTAATRAARQLTWIKM